MIKGICVGHEGTLQNVKYGISWSQHVAHILHHDIPLVFHTTFAHDIFEMEKYVHDEISLAVVNFSQKSFTLNVMLSTKVLITFIGQ